VLFLARSLGWRASIHEARATIDGRDCGPKYRVTFTPKLIDGPAPFRLARKAIRVGANDGGKGRMTVAIKQITPVSSRPVRCIRVAAEDGLFLAGRDLVATHNTFTVGNIVIGLCLEFPGTKWIWTSHHNRTTTNTFRSFQSMVNRKKIAPLLKQNRSNGIRTANGEQEIEFNNGSMIQFGAREHGFGRGLDAIDGEVFDEAQILDIKALEDMVPATNQARHPHGGLIFFIGTPPRPTDSGEPFTAKRERAIGGKSTDQMYVELGADPEAEPDDQSQWPVMNPSFPQRTPVESMLRMRENIPDDDSWRREAMGIWPKVSRHAAVIPPSVWNGLESTGPEGAVEPTAIGVDMSHGLNISVCACWLRDGFPAHIEEVWAGSDTTAALAFIAGIAERRTEVVIDDVSPASQFIPELRARKVKVRRSSARDMAKGCLLFEARGTAVPAGLSHGGQGSITNALTGARKRPISDAGGWGWDRRDSSVTIHPLVAATLALLGATYVGEQTNEAFFL
jgi:hypothetical protein